MGLRETGKSVIVVISGQGPEFSQRFHQTVLKDLRASRATLHSIVLTRPRTPILRDDVRERELTLTEGASITGGQQEDLLTSMSLTKTLADLARQLKSPQSVFTADPSSRRANVKGYSGEDLFARPFHLPFPARPVPLRSDGTHRCRSRRWRASPEQPVAPPPPRHDAVGCGRQGVSALAADLASVGAP